MVPSAMISVMHELLVALSSTMKRYYDKATMGIVMVQVPTSLIDDGESRSGERETPWIFKRCSTEASKLISLLMLPMHGSVAFRKLGLEVDPAAVAKKQQMQEKKAAKDVSVKSRVFAELRAKLHENEQLQTDPVDEAETLDDAAEDVEMTDDVDEDPEGRLNPRKRKMTDQQAQGGGVELASGSGKKAMLKSLGSGYTEEEKKLSTAVKHSLDMQEQRPKTALDDFLCAMNFVMDEIRQECEIAWTESGLTGKPLKDMRQKEEAGLQGTLAFCTMMWLEFVWSQKVNVNGKQHRIYSSLRSELQSVVRAAHVKLTTTGQPSGMKADAVDALSLGQMLVNQFAKTPVKTVVFNDEEDASVHRVAQVMATNYDGVVVPIQDYIKKVIRMPLLMHDVPRQSLLNIAATCAHNSMELCDVLGKIETEVGKFLPWQCVAFAGDVSECYVARHHFVEQTGKVFGDVATLELYLSSRLRYLFYTLDQCLVLPNFSLTTRAEHLPNILKHVVALMNNVHDDTFDDTPQAFKKSLASVSVLVAADVLMCKSQWCRTWATLLLHASTLSQLEASARELMGLPPVPEQPSKAHSAEDSNADASGVTAAKLPEGDGGQGEGEGDGDDADKAVPEEEADEPVDPAGPDDAPAAEVQETLESFQKGLSLSRINRFHIKTTIMSGSAHAEILGLKQVNSIFVRKLELHLENALWRIAGELENSRDMVVRVCEPNKHDVFVMSYPALHGRQRLPFVGRVVQGGSQAGSSQHFLCTVFGLNFYVEQLPEKHGVSAPAWSCKVVTRADLAFWEIVRANFRVIIRRGDATEWHGLGLGNAPSDSDLANLDVKVLIPHDVAREKNNLGLGARVPGAADNEDISSKTREDKGTEDLHVPDVPETAQATETETDKFEKKGQAMGDMNMGSGSGSNPTPNVMPGIHIDFHVDYLTPVANLDDKLQAELRTRREKAEKSARQLLEKSVKKVAKKGAKWDQIADAQERAAVIEQQMQNEQEADRLAKEAVEKCTMATTVTLARMASADERTSRSQRSKQMQEALQHAQQEAKGQQQPSIVDDDMAGNGYGMLAAVCAAEQAAIAGGTTRYMIMNHGHGDKTLTSASSQYVVVY
ncbi:unnamed protein product [Symbiodinium microadriaticum]|nr:unnamed protein product [Symbiodinium microadriaticum]